MLEIEEAVRKAHTLIDAMPYLRDFQRKFVVIKLGGSAQDDPGILRRIFEDVGFMLVAGMRPVVVFGGGKKISAAMKTTGREAVFVEGQRVTDPETMDVVARVLCDEVAADLEQLIHDTGTPSIRLNGRDHQFLRAIPKTLPNRPDVDLGCVGEPVAIDATPVHRAFDRSAWPDGRRRVPLVAPVACGCGRESHRLYNVNGDTAAAQIARDLGAEKLIFISDIPGVYRDPRDPETLFSSLTGNAVDQLVDEGVICGGMIPKTEACRFALDGGVRKTHIVPCGQPHALLLEIFTPRGVGTEIVP